MKTTVLRIAAAMTPLALLAGPALAGGDGWTGRRVVSEQRPNDLFYNHYVGPGPGGAAAEQYVAPLPIPAHVGHTYTTYQPLMPHELMYQHHRSYNTHHPGSGWTRTKVRYHAAGNRLQAMQWGLYDNSFFGWLNQAAFNTRVVKPWDHF